MEKRNILLIVEKPLDSSSKIIRKLLPVKTWAKRKSERRTNEVFRKLVTNDVVCDCGDNYEVFAIFESEAKETLKKFMEKNHG